MKITDFQPEPWVRNFDVHTSDPGWLYVLKSGSRLKIGTTTDFNSRFRTARTWIPDIQVVGVKPFWECIHLERILHIALSDYWIGGEWFNFDRDEFEQYFLETFCEFYDKDINRNSVEFTYWMNSTGMSEFTIEYSRRGVSLPEWRRQENYRRRNSRNGA
ncbi:GIY-YIG nuclease family protein [Aminobacter aganoensis]|uniref:GIY-YIG nuclease family protein n=1 Tax=Aminobacter aganoensis TaxID=83264 RepID=UPI0009E9B3AB